MSDLQAAVLKMHHYHPYVEYQYKKLTTEYSLSGTKLPITY